MNAARIVGNVALLACALTVAVGALHHPALAPYLRAAAGGCPIGMDVHLSPTSLDRARAQALEVDRGDDHARARPALGFRLGATTRSEAAAWAQRRGVSCTSVGTLGLRCEDAGTLAFGGGTVEVADLLFRFDAGDRLVAVDLSVEGLDAAAAAGLVRAEVDAVSSEAGPPRRSTAGSAAWSAGPLSQIGAQFRFVDYRADIRATQLGAGRIVVRATYQAS